MGGCHQRPAVAEQRRWRRPPGCHRLHEPRRWALGSARRLLSGGVDQSYSAKTVLEVIELFTEGIEGKRSSLREQKAIADAAGLGIAFYEGGVGLVEDGTIESGQVGAASALESCVRGHWSHHRALDGGGSKQ